MVSGTSLATYLSYNPFECDFDWRLNILDRREREFYFSDEIRSLIIGIIGIRSLINHRAQMPLKRVG